MADGGKTSYGAWAATPGPYGSSYGSSSSAYGYGANYGQPPPSYESSSSGGVYAGRGSSGVYAGGSSSGGGVYGGGAQASVAVTTTSSMSGFASGPREVLVYVPVRPTGLFRIARLLCWLGVMMLFAAAGSNNCWGASISGDSVTGLATVNMEYIALMWQTSDGFSYTNYMPYFGYDDSFDTVSAFLGLSSSDQQHLQATSVALAVAPVIGFIAWLCMACCGVPGTAKRPCQGGAWSGAEGRRGKMSSGVSAAAHERGRSCARDLWLLSATHARRCTHTDWIWPHSLRRCALRLRCGEQVLPGQASCS